MPGRCRDGLARWRGVSFFICQPHFRQNHVNRLEGTLQSGGRSQFLERQIILLGQQGTQLVAVAGHDGRLTPGKTVARRDIAGATTLLEKLFYQAQRHAEPVSHLRPRTFLVVIGCQDSFTQIDRSGAHEQSLPRPLNHGYSFN